MHRLKLNLEAIEHENEANKESEEGMCDSGVRVGSLLISSEGISTLGGPSFVLSLQDLKFFSEAEGGFLGKGSSGAVRRALHLQTGKIIALKEIKYTSIEHLTEIRRELETLYTSGVAPCPHLVDFYGACSYDGSVFIAMECMDGSLDTIRKPVPHRVLAEITRQILRGLVYLHRTRHLIHRDLKPSNVLYNRQTGEIKISDFGVSSYLECTKGGAQSFIGTVTYMSPERLKGDVYSYAADIWSLGLVVAELALGNFPFDDLRGDSTEARFWALVQHFSKDKPVLLLPPDLPHELTDFINLCVRKDPDQRPSCSQLLKHAFLTRSGWEEQECTSHESEEKSSIEDIVKCTPQYVEVKSKESKCKAGEQTCEQPSAEDRDDTTNDQNTNIIISDDINFSNHSNTEINSKTSYRCNNTNKELLRRWLNISSEEESLEITSLQNEAARTDTCTVSVEHHGSQNQISSNNGTLENNNKNDIDNTDDHHETNELEAIMQRHNDEINAEINLTSNQHGYTDEHVVRDERTATEEESYSNTQDENNSSNHVNTTKTHWSNSCNTKNDMKSATNAQTVNESAQDIINKTEINISNSITWQGCKMANGESTNPMKKVEEEEEIKGTKLKDEDDDTAARVVVASVADDTSTVVDFTNQHNCFQFCQVNNDNIDTRNIKLHLPKQHHSHRHHEHRRHHKSLHTRYSSPRHISSSNGNSYCHAHYLCSNESNNNNNNNCNEYNIENSNYNFIKSDRSSHSNSTGSSYHNSDVLMHPQPVIANEPQQVLNLDEELSKLLL